MNSESGQTTTEQPAAQLLGGVWSPDEHNRFLEAMQLYPQGPWKDIADHVATRSVRQVQTHAQKYHEKVARRMRGLRKERKKLLRPEHRIDDDMMSLCRELESERLQPSSSSGASVVVPGSSRLADARPRRWSQQHEVSGSAPHRLPSYERSGDHHHHHPDDHYRHSEPHVAILSRSDSTHRYSDLRLSDHDHQRHHHHGHHHQHRHHSTDSHRQHQHQHQHNLHYHKQDERQHQQQYGQPKDEFVPALVEPSRVTATHRPRHEMPSFHDCLDFLIDVFGSRECNDATWYRQHARR